jgi:HTH-type transcriptional regulator/antitoxin HipB
MSDF